MKSTPKMTTAEAIYGLISTQLRRPVAALKSHTGHYYPTTHFQLMIEPPPKMAFAARFSSPQISTGLLRRPNIGTGRIFCILKIIFWPQMYFYFCDITFLYIMGAVTRTTPFIICTSLFGWSGRQVGPRQVKLLVITGNYW